VIVVRRLTPKGGRVAIEGASTLANGARVQAPPVAGEAHDALLRWIAEAAGVSASRARLGSGGKGRVERIALAGEPAALMARLADVPYFGASGAIVASSFIIFLCIMCIWWRIMCIWWRIICM
jgi:uncharacterized protein YggU (UPF0235/DUF167 family)